MTIADEAGIIRHARALANELGPGDPGATLLAMAEQNARLTERARIASDAYNRQQQAQREAEALYMAVVERATAAEAENARLRTENRFLHHRRGVLVIQRDTERALALRLRDAWRAWRGEATAVQRENEMIMARLEAERASMR